MHPYPSEDAALAAVMAQTVDAAWIFADTVSAGPACTRTRAVHGAAVWACGRRALSRARPAQQPSLDPRRVAQAGDRNDCSAGSTDPYNCNLWRAGARPRPRPRVSAGWVARCSGRVVRGRELTAAARCCCRRPRRKVCVHPHRGHRHRVQWCRARAILLPRAAAAPRGGALSARHGGNTESGRWWRKAYRCARRRNHAGGGEEGRRHRAAHQHVLRALPAHQGCPPRRAPALRAPARRAPPRLTRARAAQSYWEICKKYNLLDECYPNAFFDGALAPPSSCSFPSSLRAAAPSPAPPTHPATPAAPDAARRGSAQRDGGLHRHQSSHQRVFGRVLQVPRVSAAARAPAARGRRCKQQPGSPPSFIEFSQRVFKTNSPLPRISRSVREHERAELPRERAHLGARVHVAQPPHCARQPH